MSDANLTTRVNEVRRAVGDDGARQHIIKTVHGRGYRFVAAMDDVAAVVSSLGLIGRDELISAIAVRLRDSSLVTCGISLWRVRRIPRVGRGTSYGGVIRNALMIRRSSGSARSAGSDSPATSIVPPTRNNRSARDEADGGG